MLKSESRFYGSGRYACQSAGTLPAHEAGLQLADLKLDLLWHTSITSHHRLAMVVRHRPEGASPEVVARHIAIPVFRNQLNHLDHVKALFR